MGSPEMKRRALLAAGLAVCTSFLPFVSMSTARAAASDDELARAITARLAQTYGVRARFTQTRTLAVTKAPLVSHGEVVVARDHGIIWRVTDPYQATFVIGEQGVEEFDAAGARIAQRRGAARAGAIATRASAMARAVLSGDLSPLYAQFDVHASGSPEHWNMTLEPNQPQLAQAIKSLRLEGKAQLQRLQLTTSAGDVTLIEFVASAPFMQLPEAEQRMFEARR